MSATSTAVGLVLGELAALGLVWAAAGTARDRRRPLVLGTAVVVLATAALTWVGAGLEVMRS